MTEGSEVVPMKDPDSVSEVAESTSTPGVEPTEHPDSKNGGVDPESTSQEENDSDNKSGSEEDDAASKLYSKKSYEDESAKRTSDKKTILDEDVPLSDSAPDTGDTTNLWFPMIVMSLSLAAIIVVIVVRKKANE